MSEAVIVAIIEAVPVLLALVVVAVLLAVHRRSLSGLLSRVSGLSVAGIELTLDPTAVQAARPDAAISDDAAAGLAARATRNREVIRGRRVLWVDDNPRGNDVERKILRSMGVSVHNALSTGDALAELARDDYDAVITDQDRGRGDDGEVFAGEVRAAGDRIPIIAYVGRVDPRRGTPPVFDGITDRPDTMLHLLLDSFERHPGPSARRRAQDRAA